jgi:hypothetical protein
VSERRRQRQIPRITLTQTEAADSLGVSVDFFAEYVKPDVPVIRKGSKRLYRVRDLDAWAEQNAELTLGGVR